MAKKKTKATADNKQFYRQWWFWVIIVFVVVGAIGAIISPPENAEQSSNETAEESSAKNLKKNARGGFIADEYDFSLQCQVLAEQLTNNDIKVIDIWNDNDYFTEQNGYDKDGNSIALYTWNGKQKSTGKTVSFGCWGKQTSKEEITIYELNMNLVTLYGDSNFPVYNEAGELQN